MAIAQNAVRGNDLIPRLREFIDRQRPGAARPLLNAVRRLVPSSEQIDELEARLLLLEGKGAAACAVLDEAIMKAPKSVALLLARATARGQQGDSASAARDAAEAVILDPTKAQAKGLLGVFLHRLRRHEEARRCLFEAVALAPDEGGYRRYLALAHAACGDEAAASATIDEGIRRAPRDVALRIAAILCRMRQGDFHGAEATALAASEAGAADAVVLGLLGHARSNLGRHDDAAEAYAEARKLAPEDPYVSHLAAAGGFAQDAGRASKDYVRVVFDGYASRFDGHLMALGYRVPGLIRAELENLRSARAATGPVLDLGCGTGLLAVTAADERLQNWIGVDLSPKMLAEAKRRQLYAELHEADIESFLNSEQRRFPIILAGDAMPYFGDLSRVFRAAAARLAPGGHFILSVELLRNVGTETIGWKLGRLSRYAHSRPHVVDAAELAGLSVMSIREEVVRLEGDDTVTGLIVVLENSGA